MANALVVYSSLPNGEYVQKEVLSIDPLPAWCVPPLLERHVEFCRISRYFWARVRDAYVAVGFSGSCDLALGVLLRLWARNQFVLPCPTCGRTAYLIRMFVMPLSGSNAWNGVCPHCDREICGSLESPHKVGMPALNMGKVHTNSVRIDPGERARRTWDGRVIGRATPDRLVGFQHDWRPLSEILGEVLGQNPRYAERVVAFREEVVRSLAEPAPCEEI